MEMFESIKRPRAEMRVISLFISKYESAFKNYKSHSYQNALREFIELSDIIVPIHDVIPKCSVSYYLMKSKYKCRFYRESLAEIDELTQLIELINHDSVLYIKIKTKTFLYRSFCNIILNDNNESIMNIIDSIVYFNSKEFNAQTKVTIFWIFFKGFLGESKLNKTKQFEEFKEYYDELRQSIQTNEVKKNIKDVYKKLMSTKNRKVIFDAFNHAFYFHKYRLGSQNKVIIFLENNLPEHARTNGMPILKKKFETYLNFNKIDLSLDWGSTTMISLINEQYFRLISFDTLFSNLCGAFDVIFSEYYIISDVKKQIKPANIQRLKLFFENRNNLIASMRSSMNESATDRLTKNSSCSKPSDTYKYSLLSKNMKIPQSCRSTKNTSLVPINSSNQINNSLKKSESCRCYPYFDFQKDIAIPPNYNNEEDDSNIKKCIRLKRSNFNTKRPGTGIGTGTENIIRKKQSSISYSKIFDMTNHGKSKLIPKIKTALKEREYNMFEIQQQLSTKNMTTSTSRSSLGKFVLRNYNNYLFTTIMNQFVTKPYLKSNDLFNCKIPNVVCNYSSQSMKGFHSLKLRDNQDVSFAFENFLLIKNFYIFGVCDGHGRYGKEIAEAVQYLFPTNLLYMIIDNDLIKRKENLNQIVISLFKAEDKPEVKEMNIIKYFFNKFDIDYENISFVRHSFNNIKNEIAESIVRTHHDCKNKNHIDFDSSGCTLCSVLVYGKTLYLINIGDSRAYLGTNIYEKNSWTDKQLTFDHKPENLLEAKRITVLGGRIAKSKNENGKETGPFRVWFKEIDSTTPGLSMSRSIGDNLSKKIGISNEPDVTEYTLHPNDKIIIIGTDGFWDLISSKEAISICGKLYETGISSEHATEELINIINDKIETKELSSYDDITCIVVFLNVK